MVGYTYFMRISHGTNCLAARFFLAGAVALVCLCGLREVDLPLDVLAG